MQSKLRGSDNGPAVEERESSSATTSTGIKKYITTPRTNES